MDGRAKLHADIAHPIHAAAREQIQGAVIRAYFEEKERSKLPGYVCRYDDYDSDFEEADAAMSYGGIVSELGRTVKVHGPHASVPKAVGRTTEVRKMATSSGDSFGVGID